MGAVVVYLPPQCRLTRWLIDSPPSLFLPQELRERVLRGKYRIPFYMSTDCENLLKKFLILNPSKRGTLEVSSAQPGAFGQDPRAQEGVMSSGI